MEEINPKPAPHGRWRRRFLVAVGGLVALVVVAVLLLPRAISTPPARRWLLDRANRVLAPSGRLVVGSFRFSWVGPTRMTDFRILDARGKPLLAAPRAVWDCSLGRILFDRPRYGTLRLERYRLDVTRGPDGAVDLLQAIAPILTPDPRSDWTLDLVEGSVQAKGEPLAALIAGNPAHIIIRRPPAPQPLSWQVALRQGEGAGAASLNVAGSFNRWRATPEKPGDLELTVTGGSWPLAIDRAEGSVSVTWTGQFDATRHGGRWASRGRSRLDPLRVVPKDSPPIRMDRLDAGWDVAQTPEGWRLARLDLDGDAGTVHARGEVAGATVRTHLEGDLAPARLLTLFQADRPTLPLGLDLDQARVALTADLERTPGGAEAFAPISLTADLRLTGLKRRDGEQTTAFNEVSLSVEGAYDRGGDSVDLKALEVRADEGTARLSGRVDDLGGAARANLSGQLVADWSQLIARLFGRLDEEVKLEVGPIAFQARGGLRGKRVEVMRGLDWRVEVPVTQADAFGMELGPVRLGARSQEGQLQLDPIETTLNGGRLRLGPEIVATDDWTAAALRLAPGSSLEGAQINDEVSRRVLAFVVPTMADATRVNGRVSARFDRAEIPLSGPGQTVIEGNIVFDDVTFSPGPLADQLLGLAGPGERGPMLRLAQPVLLSVHDGRVYQRGLAVPLANIARVEMEGWVDFHKNLELDVQVPLAAERLAAERPVLALIAGGVRPTIPIRGTLDNPRVDTEALGRNMGRMGLDVAGRAGLGFGAALLERATRPRTPEEQARIDAEQARREMERQQRKALQEQKRQERRMRRSQG